MPRRYSDLLDDRLDARIGLTNRSIRAKSVKQIESYWYSRSFVVLLLLPLSWIYHLVAATRKWAYRIGLLKVHTITVPVIIVGNINVGGTGKSPLVIWLVEYLKKEGFLPGVISRGYGGQARIWPQQVVPGSDARAVGEEAIMISRRCNVPMAVGPDRVAAAKSLLKYTDCNIIVADDGMQHYALGRDIEVAVVDGVRRFGNGYFLPAGPLRESKARLSEVDLIVVNGTAGPGEYQMKLVNNQVINCRDESIQKNFNDFKNSEVHAIAGIGNPKRFFSDLKKAGLTVIEHPFRDHYFFNADDISYNDEKQVLMTEKDAVKCKSIAQSQHWYVPVDAKLDERFGPKLLMLLDKAIRKKEKTARG